MSDPKVHLIDGVNYVRRTVPTAEGPVELEGLTVRALRQALEHADPDDLVCYMAERTPEIVASELIIGVVAGVLSDGNCGTSFIVGPEAVKAVKNAGMMK